MDIIQLYNDYSVDFLTEGHKHCRPGWVNTPCPFCTGNPGYHLGYEIQNNRFTCWRCGWHPVTLAISRIINIPEREVRKILSQYGLLVPRIPNIVEAKSGIKPYHLPSLTGPLQTNHIKYLEGRGFDPIYLQQQFNLIGTGPVSHLDGLDYKLRIVIPFIWDRQEVTFDSRDITNKHPYKYLACPLEREKIPHKSILYGKQEEWKETGICVEGPTDVWKLGVNSFATSGIKFTPMQVRNAAKYFKRVAIVFDDDLQAKIQATKLVSELKFRGVDAFRVDIESDPGSMKQEDADYLVKQLMK